jgi:hypothetical protein
VLLRRSVPVPGILATHRPGAIMDKSGRQFVARSDWGANVPLRTQRAKIFSQLLTKRKPGPHTKKPTLPFLFQIFTRSPRGVLLNFFSATASSAALRQLLLKFSRASARWDAPELLNS